MRYVIAGNEKQYVNFCYGEKLRPDDHKNIRRLSDHRSIRGTRIEDEDTIELIGLWAMNPRSLFREVITCCRSKERAEAFARQLGWGWVMEHGEGVTESSFREDAKRLRALFPQLANAVWDSVRTFRHDEPEYESAEALLADVDELTRRLTERGHPEL